MRSVRARVAAVGMVVLSAPGLAGCGANEPSTPVAGTTTGSTPTAPTTPSSVVGSPASTGSATTKTARPTTTTTRPVERLKAGTTKERAAVPKEARAVDTSKPDRVVGTGTKRSCTSKAVVAAVAKGGVITFDCGPRPVTITLTATAKVVNAASKQVVLDGGGLVTLSGGGKRRILYLNTCDQAQGWTTSHCQDQDHPRLVVQNLTFADGDATGQTTDGGGGGAIFVRGGRFRAVNTRFVRNRCDPSGPDVGGAAIRVLDQWQDKPVYVVSSTFGGGKGLGGRCSNGGALSSIGVSWEILNSVFTHNEAIGAGANPAKAGTPGGGSGGAIYTDGNGFTVRIAGSRVEDNHAAEGGGALFFVSNDRSGTLRIENSTLRRNPSDGFETSGLAGIFYLGSGDPVIVGARPR